MHIAEYAIMYDRMPSYVHHYVFKKKKKRLHACLDVSNGSGTVLLTSLNKIFLFKIRTNSKLKDRS